MADFFNVGDTVARKSYNMDVIFKITEINGENANLAGLTVRILADSPLYDLIKVEKENIERVNNKIEDRCLEVIKNRNVMYKNTYYNVMKEELNQYMKQDVPRSYIKTGVILHLDGDKEYADKCRILYSRLGINNYVYYVKEEEQPKCVYALLEKIKPNILVLTGHDALKKRTHDIYDINNYKNSRYFAEAVLEARRYEHNLDSLAIFAGACQSYYEAIITAGANFASSPKRVLIDVMDPIIVAENIAMTTVDRYVKLNGIIMNTREGIKGIGGVQTRGMAREGLPKF